MKLDYVLLLLFHLCFVNTELISVITGTTIAISAGAFWGLKDRLKCYLYECCHEPDVNFNYHTLDADIANLLFGQHLVKDVVVNSIKSHWYNENPRKPLVLSFHGYTGSGKNYVAEIIANNTFRLGLRSTFVQHIVATNDFPDKNKLEEYQVELRNRILTTVQKCQRSIFIFDEADKLPEQLLGAIKPFLDYYSTISGVDFRRSIFILLSNKGGGEIARITKEQYESGYPREQLRLEAFERELMNFSYNEKGGLQMSELISNHLIDHFVPFLPLQREHVRSCVGAYLRKRGRGDLVSNVDFVERVLNSLQYFPESSKAFSSSGCKRVDAKTDLEMAKIRPLLSSVHFDDEL
ncbi:Torsin-like protein [Caenorhabditis elegans]|uniref:Isoform a of Torsin-like protein n=1 Tax=Caenorhabditis elegans TaxID=6239 RepID=Q95NU5-2|nr:Torsin-like protein [Caenorhabditis elegans]CAC44293.1 Torsin-like protein [Caenorhabditis elegans]|eukprot:NP_495917.1 Torsin-like protein [Caenorhabditis elegans]